MSVCKNFQLQYEIEQWLYREAELLDALKFEEWYNLLTDDIVYEMPQRLNQEGNRGPLTSMDTFYFTEDKVTLKLRVDRLLSEFAWAEMPPSRTRRQVTNVRIKEVINENELLVYSNLLIYRNRNQEPTADLISGERQDVFKKISGEWKLRKRLFLLDQTVLGTRNLAIFV